MTAINPHEAPSSQIDTGLQLLHEQLGGDIMLIDGLNDFYHESLRKLTSNTYRAIQSNAQVSPLKMRFESELSRDVSSSDRVASQRQFAEKHARRHAEGRLSLKIDQIIASLQLEGNDPRRDIIASKLSDLAHLSPEQWYGDENEGIIGQRNTFMDQSASQELTDLTRSVDTGESSADVIEPEAEEFDMEALQTEAILENARFDVGKSRDSWAKAASKRLGRAFSLKDKEREKLRDDYHKNVQELGKLELQAVLEDDSVSADEKNIAVITFLFDEQKKLREKTLENLKSTKVSRFVEWMNKGNVATRIAKGVSIGALAGVAGGVLAGAAGAGVIAAGTIAGSRFVKGYAAKDRHRGSKMSAKLDDVDAHNSDDTKLVLEHLSESNSSDTLEAASEKVNSFFEDDIKDEQKERKKALAVGAISVAAGAGIGYGISHIGVLGDAKDAIHDKLSDWIGGHSDGAASTSPQDVAPSGPAIESGGGSGATEVIHGRGEMFDGYMGTRSLTPGAIDLMHEQLNGYTVKPGDSVWSLSESFLQDQGIKHPTVYEIDATKDVLLKELRAEGLADAKGWLSVGDTLRIK